MKITPLLVVACMAALPACGSSDDDGAAKPSGSGGAGAGSKSSGDAPQRAAKVVATSTKKGAFPAALASATVEDPGTLKVRVTPSPAADAAVSWTVACRRGSKAGTKSGRFDVSAATTKTLRKPLQRSDICNVSASAQMTKRGSIKVEIIG